MEQTDETKDVKDNLSRLLKPNKLYCLITKQNGYEYLELSFVEILATINFDDSDFIIGHDVNDESIYFTYIEESKAIEIINFFKRNNILVSCQCVKNVIDFIQSDKKYMDVYENNKQTVDNFIIENVNSDDVLDRMINYPLLQVELDILNKKTSEYSLVSFV
jgi:hypothetical protein